MISGTFSFSGDIMSDIEVWEEDVLTDGFEGKIRYVFFRQNGHILRIPKDFYEEFCDFVNSKKVKAKESHEIIKLISNLFKEPLTPWERDFINSIATRVEVAGVDSLSDKQSEVLLKISRKYNV